MRLRTAANWLVGGLAGCLPAVALAQEGAETLGDASTEYNGPYPWQMGLQEAGTPIMEQVLSFHSLLMWVITFIVLVVMALLAYVSVKFAANKNPTPSKRSHHTVLEVIWTAVPVLILVIIAIPSFKLLYYMDDLPETEMTLKAIGRQWYWTYEYPDHGNFQFDAFPLGEDDLAEGQPRLLTTDNAVVLPAGVNVRVQVTSSDVLHSWAMPSAGLKVDAVPGRLNELWVNFKEPGMYYGQCSELCGVNHGFMPIMIHAVEPERFAAWVEEAQEEFAGAAPERPAGGGEDEATRLAQRQDEAAQGAPQG